MLHPDTELRMINPQIGYGVFARKRIPKGTVTWVLDKLDIVLSQEEVAALGQTYLPILEHYAWVTGKGTRILCWDFGRFMNHSCDANTFGPGGAEFEVAVRDIEAGEELTSDYGTLNLEHPLRCSCGAASCRGTIRAEDFDDLAPVWDQKIRAAVPLALSVPQPLEKWFKSFETVRSMVEEPEAIPSISAHRYDGEPVAVARMSKQVRA